MPFTYIRKGVTRMSENIIRHDIVQVDFNVNNGGLTKVNEELDKLQTTVSGGVDKSIKETTKAVDKMKDSFSGVEKSTNAISSTTKKFQSVNKAIQDGDNILKNLSSRIKSIPHNAVDKVKNSFTKMKEQSSKALTTIKNLAKQKMTKLKQDVEQTHKALTQGQKGAKGFVTMLKNIGKVSVAKTTNGIKNVVTKIKDGTSETKEFNKKLKDTIKIRFDKLKTNLDKVKVKLSTIAKKAAGTALTGLKKLAGVSFRALTIGIGAAATAIGGLVTKSVSAFADFEQNIGGVQKLFGAGGKSLKDYAKDVGKSTDKVKAEYDKLIKAEKEVIKNANNSHILGFDANTYMETVTGFSASLITDLKGDTVKAADLSNMAIKDMADNANVFGTDLSTVQQVYQGLAKNQYVLLDNLKLGYGGSKEGAEKLVADAAKVDKSIKSNDLSFSNMVKAINVVQKKMGVFEATEKEATGTITGSLNMTKAAWGNLLIAIGSGENLDQCIENMINSVETFGNNVIPVAEKALGGIGTVIERLAPVIAEKIPPLVEKLLPPLIKGAVSLTAALIKALPSIVKAIAKEMPDILQTLWEAIAETFDIKIPLDKFKGFFTSIGDFLTKSSGKITKIIPLVLGLVGAFKLFKGISSITSLFKKPKGGGDKGEGGLFDSIVNVFKSLAKAKPTDILKGMANLAIILGGITLLTAIFIKIAPCLAEMNDFKSLIELVGAIALVGVVGAALAKLASIVGKIPVSTVAKGLANIAIIIAGMSALFLLIGAVSLINFDLDKIMHITKIIGVLGTVGAVLSVFAGIVGLIPIPVVLTGLANIALVLGGITTLIVAFGALTKIKGFTEFIEKGGQILVKIFDIIGQMAGSLIGGLAEGISNALPTLGKNLGKFGKNIKPLFDNMKGIDMGGVGAFFTSLVGLLGMATGNDIIEGIKSFFGGDDESAIAKFGTELSNFATNSKGFFQTVAALPEGSFAKGNQLFECLAKMKDLPSTKKGGSTKLAAIATDLGAFNGKASGFFTSIKNYDLAKVNELWSSLGGADSLTSETLKSVNENLDSIISKVSDLPNEMAKGIKASGDSLATAFVEIWTKAVKATSKPVNKLIEGANWILKEFGSDKKVVSWQPYAKGTNGHKGGNALVNDGRGAEMVQMPNGNTFIPRGRNVFIPNAPKGMKVLPAENTAQLMGKNSPTFRYANGVGNIDIWDYYENATGLIDSVSKKYVNYNGASGLALNISKGMVSTVKGEMGAWAKKLYDEMGGMSLADYDPSKGVMQWRSTVIRALKMEGLYSAANVARTLFQMQTESGGNPKAINLWDSNAKKGIPSKGLMQVIDPTFKAYARKGFDKNIYDPLSNILASVRYAVSRYGTLAKAYRGVGYANGGLVTRTGMIAENPQHPEWVIPTDPSKRMRALSLYRQAGQSLGLSSYTPENSMDSYYSGSNRTEYNTYSPQFSITVNGAEDARATERKVRRWVKESLAETFDNMSSKNPKLREV